MDALSGDLAHIRNCAQLLHRCAHQRVQRAEVRGEGLCRLDADLTNAERGQQARKIVLLACFDCLAEVVRRFLSLTRQLRKGLIVELVEVGGVGDHFMFDQLIDDGASEAVDVHCLARDEVCQIP